MRRAFAVAVATVLAVGTAAPIAGATEARRDVTFSIAVHVARDKDAPVQTDAWIDAQIARAESLYGPIGVHFERASTRPLPEAFTHLESRADRDGLAAELDKGKISVMIVGSLRDVDDPSLMRQGVHWHATKATAKHYIIVSSVAGSTVLAHELGHFFGNPHTQIEDNLMSYNRSSANVFLTEGQKKTTWAFAGIYTRSKELVAK